ncbi:hypothetical protein POM88_019866 [Heracleum sosnowskyi]|uniref:Pectate lyase domain-containing protein n=1 Tax=Heracleum sosnowskyi TaxID=360622 RepID=A0AAD8IAS2_9APIA|nr:hypothetical protein POM88_019866 [Heracleum sosnowskyi]
MHTGVPVGSLILRKKTIVWMMNREKPVNSVFLNYRLYLTKKTSKSSSTGIAIGAAAGGSVVMLLLLLAGFYAFRQKRRAARATQQSNAFDANANCEHVILLGHSDSYTRDKVMQVTIAYNHFGEGLIQRMPRKCYATGGSANPTINSQGNRYLAPNNPFAKEPRKGHYIILLDYGNKDD